MRLPAITAQQQQREAAREFHEQLWANRASGVVVDTTPATAVRDVVQLSNRAKWFWKSRGFRARVATRRDKRAIRIWLEAV